MTSHASNRNGGMLIARNELSMPKWVTEQSDRIGPKPPPLPLTPERGQTPPKQPSLSQKTKQPEPDYEVIEFSNQQYSNAPVRPNSASSGSKTPDNKLKCTLCGSGNPWVTCDECTQQIFCASCDDMFHKHPKRKSHQRKTIEKSRPPLPPKVLPGQPGPIPPVAPPRRNKRGFITPIMQRKDQGNSIKGPFPDPSSPTPSMKNLSWQERLGSLPKGLNLLNRPLPETPKTPSESSRSTTPKSIFDNIQRPPSVALERIKSKANATLDRMQLLQQRYRQQKEQMERERSGSATDQNMSAFDQWSSISQSSSHFRSGSISSGINSSHLDLMDDTNFNLFHQRQMALQQIGQRGMSSSVFNLNQIKRQQPIANNGWINNPMQQAQSMAQLNCTNCAQHQIQWNGLNQHLMHKAQDPWSNQLSSQQHMNRSNMSLNVSAGYMMQPQINNMYPPPTFMNQSNLMPQMYSQSYIRGMPVHNPGLICMPPSTSRAASRAGSRMTSPAMSRKSAILIRKQRTGYINDEATDDEDTDEDDCRSITSTRSGVSRPRQRRLSSASQFQIDDNFESTHAKLHRNRTRNQRRDSVAKSVHNDWTPGRRTSSINNNRSADSGFNSPLKQSRIYSDLDSEGSGTRALVQAKIEQKLKEESLKHAKPKRQSKSPPPQKTSAAVQTSPVKQGNKKDKIEKPTDERRKHEKKLSQNELEKEDQNDKNNESVEVVEMQKSAREEEKEGESRSEPSGESDLKEESGKTEVWNNIEQDDLGPPPSTPDHEWECEFCTFVNEANIKICSICCKTPSFEPKKTIKSISPPQQNKTENQHMKTEDNRPVKHKSGTIKRTQLNSSQPLSIETNNTKASTNTNNLQKLKTDSLFNTNDRNESTINSRVTLKNKESVEDIWATLDENIQTTTHEITRKAQFKKPSKASYTCGSSSTSLSVEPQENFLRRSQLKDTDTSSSPQSISTQTYNTLPTRKPEAKDEEVEKSGPQPLNDDVIKHTNSPLYPKIQDLKSFESEVLNNIHNINHVASHYHNHHENHSVFSYNDRQRYCCNNDLPEEFNGLGNQQPSIREPILSQKTSSHMYSPFGGSTFDLPFRELSSVKPNDAEIHKESDLYKYTTEELNAALKYCGPDIHPLVWLRNNWPKLIQTVQSLATKYGQERSENTIGTISQMEARDALRLHTGNIWQAVSECIEQRQRKYREISSKDNFSREDIVTALTTHQGNIELALLDLERTQLKPFLMRIWGSPGGVENESGTQPLVAAAHYNSDKDIHNFLSANALECMQIPNASNTRLINQIPSPFDRPTSFYSPFENNSHVLDNSSTYSTENKNFANSSVQLDESITGNKHVLKDLETLIGNMEHSQQTQNEQVLRSIHDMISNVSSKTEKEYDSESMRILTKSPIISPVKDNTSENEVDIKNFVWQHIQEIVPNLVQQVEMELVEDIEDNIKSFDPIEKRIENTPETKQTTSISPPPPIDQDEFLMEEVIKPKIKNAFIREELPPKYIYSAEITTFQLAFDKSLQREHEEEFEYLTLEEASRIVYKMYKSPEALNKQRESEITNQIIVTATEVGIKDIPSVTQIDSSNANVFDENMGSHAPQIHFLELLSIQNDNLKEAEIGFEVFSKTKYKTLTKKSDETQSYTETSKTLDESSVTPNNFCVNENYNQTATISPSEINVDRINTNKISNLKHKMTDSFEEAISNEDNDFLAEHNYTTTTNVNQPTLTSRLHDKRNSSISENSASMAVSVIPALNISQVLYSSSPLIDDKAENDTQDFVKTTSDYSIHPNNNQTVFAIELKNLKSESSIKRISKIPVRRTASNKSLNKTQKLNLAESKAETEIPQPPSEMEQPIISQTDEESEEKELYSIDSNRSVTEVVSRAEQYPSTSSEIFLVIHQEGSENTITIAPSTSSSTLHSTISPSSSFKSPSEFIPSSDPSKQNLTELVEDTQRLIKQMKDEISLDDFESSTDDSEYSDDFSDEYDNEEEEEEEEYWEKEEDEDVEEYDDIAEDITIEEDSLSKTQSPLLSQELQDHRATQNSSALSNISSNHSLPFLYDHFEQNDLIITKNNDTQNQNILVNETAKFVTTENNLPELPAETVTYNNLEKSQSITRYPETENNLPELSVETVLEHAITQDDNILTTQNHSNTLNGFKDKSALASGSRDILSASTSVSYELESDNGLPEMAVEQVISKMHVENAKNNLNPTYNEDFLTRNESGLPISTNNHILTVEAVSNDHTETKTSNGISSINLQAKTTAHTLMGNSINQPAEVEFISDSHQTGTTIAPTDFSSSQHNLTSTGIANKVSEGSLHNPLDEQSHKQNNASEAYDDSFPSTSKSIQTNKKTYEEVKISVKKSNTTSKIPKLKENAKEPKQKEAVASNPKNDFQKKIYTRSKSFSGPSTPIGIASVKTISQKFISPSPITQLTKPKKHLSSTKRSSIVETINKFMKPSTSSEKHVVNSLFKSRTQPRLPKKKYHETCFSDDDYESSSSKEEIEPFDVRQRKLSVPVFKAYPSVQEPEEVNTEKLVKKFMKEELASTVAEAQLAATLVSMKFQQDVSLWAAKECSDLDHAITLLKQECELCSGTYALNQIVSMLKCTHKCCKQCAKTYFTVQITERSINDCSCPFCKLPELHNQNEQENENLEYFSNLDIYLKNILDPEVHELFQRKLRDRTLLKDPNFKWCVQCSSGFFARPKQKRLICPDCGSVTCAQCRKTWQKQHEGISCDQFSEWESANDPEAQAKGVQQHLEQNGIDCPKCKFKYSLARGGCMHFTCTQCKYEFCYGCAKPFMMGAKCTISPYCAKLGLHAHHPRNCLFYLRDKLPVQLQILLKNYNVPFEVDPAGVPDSGDGNEPSSSKIMDLICSIAIQKETPTGLVDTRCNGDVPEKHAGMCRNHYVEYLTAKVAKAKIDPLPIFDLTDCVQELRRRGLPLPERGPWDTDEIYKNMCAEVIKNNIPLDMD